ncbi:PREDICTED: girdin-like [Polistes dominula]|uniref:Girdin-like n=1 Tax=Polistes dominula TaxID=743375 RepID=A0ABM1HW54_POLDO|nr:PREDICTED: girdin-like [Polistes dominula]
MRRTRHVVLPVRSWQYIGLLLVSLACVTFGLVARDREGQAGSLTGPELLHRAPHGVDVCPNLNPFAKSSVSLDLPEKQNFDLETNEGKYDKSDVVRIDKRSTELDINKNELSEKRHRTINERRISERSSNPMKKFSRSLDRMNSKIDNVRLFYRNSPNSEIIGNLINRRRYSSRRYSNDRSRSTERHEEHGSEPKTEQRNFENRELKERRHRFGKDTRRMVDSQSIKRKETRGQIREKREVRTMRENRNNIREEIQDRRSKSVERREFKIEDSERQLMKVRRTNEHRNSRINISNRQSKLGKELETLKRGRQLNVDVERRNFRLDTLNRERRMSENTERRNSQLDTLNRQRRSSLSTERRDSRLDTLNRERRLSVDVERRSSRLDNLNRQRRSNLSTERRDSRLDTLNRERRLSVDVERRSSRLDNLNRQRKSNLSTERRNSRLDTSKRERRLSVDTERRNFRLDTLNRERRLSEDGKRRNSRLDTSNRDRQLSVDTERRNSRLENHNRQFRSSSKTEPRNSRLYTVNRERQSNEDVEHRNTRLDTLNRQRRLNEDAERKNSRLDISNRERRLSVNIVRRNSRLDTTNHERRLSSMADRTSTRITRENRRDSESFNLNSLRTKSTSQQDIRRENIRSQIRNMKFNLIEQKQSGNRLEDQRFGRRMLDLEDRKSFDRRSRSVEQRNINALNRDSTYLGLRRRFSVVRNSEHRNHRDDIKRDLINRLSRSLFTEKDSRGETVHFKADRSSESLDRYKQRKIFSNREFIRTPKQNRHEFTALKRIIQSLNAKNLRNTLHTARNSFDSSLQLDHTRIERNNLSNERLNERSTRGQIDDEISLPQKRLTRNRQHRIARIFTPEISNRKSFIIRKFHVSKRAERLSRSLDNINRLNSNERRDSTENRRFRTNNDHSLSTERRDIQQQRENLPRTSISVLTNNSKEQRRLNTRIQERNNERVERMMNKKLRSSDSRLIGKGERLMVLRSRDHHRDIRLNLKKGHNDLPIRYIDSLTRRENSNSKIFNEFRSEEYGGKIGMISNLLKTNVLLDYNVSFGIIRQLFLIIICILYGSSMTKNNKLFTGNLMERITKLVLR